MGKAKKNRASGAAFEFDILTSMHPRVWQWRQLMAEKLKVEAKAMYGEAWRLRPLDDKRRELEQKSRELENEARAYKGGFGPGDPGPRGNGMLIQLSEMVSEGWEVVSYSVSQESHYILVRRAKS